jgi:hypothetical protein
MKEELGSTVLAAVSLIRVSTGFLRCDLNLTKDLV